MDCSQYYVDPSIAASSGTGVIGDPYGDIQYALDQVTRDSTNGDRFNIKAGTDESLAASLDLTTYGTPSASAPLIFQGYTSAADDGGIGGIDGNATYSIMSTTYSYVWFIDMHLHNTGSNAVANMNANVRFENCEVDNSTGSGIVTGWDSRVEGCYVHNVGGIGISMNQHGYAGHNYIKNGTNDVSSAIQMGRGGVVEHNIINIDGSSQGITVSAISTTIRNNTIYCSAGTGIGIDNNSEDGTLIQNNYVEGFSGTGGVGIYAADFEVGVLRGNRYYNNTTNESLGGTAPIINADNSAVGSSALTDPGNEDFSVGTDLKAGAWPTSYPSISQTQYLDIGAVQREEPAGGGGGTGLFVHPGMGGGARG